MQCEALRSAGVFSPARITAGGAVLSPAAGRRGGGIRQDRRSGCGRREPGKPSWQARFGRWPESGVRDSHWSGPWKPGWQARFGRRARKWRSGIAIGQARNTAGQAEAAAAGRTGHGIGGADGGCRCTAAGQARPSGSPANTGRGRASAHPCQFPYRFPLLACAVPAPLAVPVPAISRGSRPRGVLRGHPVGSGRCTAAGQAQDGDDPVAVGGRREPAGSSRWRPHDRDAGAGQAVVTRVPGRRPAFRAGLPPGSPRLSHPAPPGFLIGLPPGFLTGLPPGFPPGSPRLRGRCPRRRFRQPPIGGFAQPAGWGLSIGVFDEGV